MSRSLLTLVLLLGCDVGVRGPQSERTDQPAPQAPTPDPGSDREPDGRALVLVSLDGFRADYLDRYETPNLDRVAAGVRAASLQPPFPSYTFPSHYTLVTGLHPERHGIVSNVFFDPVFGQTFKLGEPASMSSAKWWGGEPIWNTAERQGVRAATLFWVGSEAPINGMRPSDWTPYDYTLPHSERVRRVLDWLARPEERRPGVITLYFSAVDSAGHRHGPDSAQVAAKVADLDQAIGQLLDGIAQADLAELVDVVVVSDHGMATRSPERLVVLDEQGVDLSAMRVVEWSPLLAVNPHDGRHDEVLEQLSAVEHIACYPRDATPSAWHYREHRAIAQIVCLADNGWQIASADYARARPENLTGGTHGWDPSWQEMHGIFLANGPRFKNSLTVPTLHAVDLYGVLCEALDIEPAPHQGDPARAAELLSSTP